MTSLKRKGEHKDDGGHAKEAKKDYGMSAELLADTRVSLCTVHGAGLGLVPTPFLACG